MRNLVTAIGTAAVTAGLIVGTSGIAFADSYDDHSVRDNHSNPVCSQPHTINIATCVGPVVDGPVLDLGPIL
jgi:hypothetical protein